MGVDRLTEREKETLRLLLAGHDAKSSARELGLSVHTVNERLRDARRKLAVGSSREAARMLAETERGEGQVAGGSTPQSFGPKPFGVAGGGGGAPSASQRGRRLAWIAGGLTMIAIVAAALLLTPSTQQTPPASVSEEARAPSVADARRWIALVDAGGWADSWQAAGPAFRTQITAAQWAAAVRPVREPLGPVSERRFVSATPTATPPGAPAGEYEILQFATNFANRPGAVETVVMARESTRWGVVGYFVR